MFVSFLANEVKNNNQNYKIVSDELYKNGIFDDNDNEIDNEYLVSYVNMRKYPTTLFLMSKIMEMNNNQQNQVAMYLYNNIEI